MGREGGERIGTNEKQTTFSQHVDEWKEAAMRAITVTTMTTMQNQVKGGVRRSGVRWGVGVGEVGGGCWGRGRERGGGGGGLGGGPENQHKD